MAHFAKLNENNVVIDVIRINDKDCGGGEYPKSEESGRKFIARLGIDGNWVQTSYNKSFRNTYGQPGCIFMPELDVFVEPKPFDSWVLDSNYEWIAPIAKPTDGKEYLWNEVQNTWDLKVS